MGSSFISSRLLTTSYIAPRTSYRFYHLVHRTSKLVPRLRSSLLGWSPGVAGLPLSGCGRRTPPTYNHSCLRIRTLAIGSVHLAMAGTLALFSFSRRVVIPAGSLLSISLKVHFELIELLLIQDLFYLFQMGDTILGLL